jgi:glycerophosphoryl diester phosphodiesterase
MSSTPSFDFGNQFIVDDKHNRGLKVFVYGVDHPEDIAKMQGMGVDGVFTGFSERVLENYVQGDKFKWT